MNTNRTNPIIRRTFLTVLLTSMGIIPTHAQYTFNCGSTGTWNGNGNGGNGVMNITANTTLDMPANGIFNCTTINVAAGATLKFNPNSLNTPVYLLATGDVTISGTIDVSGSLATTNLGGVAGPGGFAGGNPGAGGLSAGDGHGPGAGRAGALESYEGAGTAAYGTAGHNYYPSSKNGTTYGSPLLVPLVGGSGGGAIIGGSGGAGGGGAVLIASNTRIDVQGSILATSPSLGSQGKNSYGFGSGGAIRLLSPIVAGTGNLNTSGGWHVWGSTYGAGSGRIRIDCMDRRSLGFTYTGTVSTGANMLTFPSPLTRLDITQAAGRNIDVGTNTAVSFMLPQDSSPNRTVTVQASNFGAVVPIRVVLTPDNGSSIAYDAQIDNTAAGSASVTVPVVVPVNVNVSVEAWTR